MRKKYRMRDKTLANVVYPALADWLRKNDMSICALAQQMGYKDGNTKVVYDLLYGRFQPTIPTIRKLLTATGLTFEQAFGGVESAET